ncbi:MAG: MEDS domain-containing protein [Ignavibacteria bacterium]|nr:MEDS domain-containing protein [Ignavibacteria bacterium]
MARIPYFKAGLKNNEKCIWITSQPLNSNDAYKALSNDIPALNKYFENKQIEIIEANQWYFNNKKLKPVDEILQNWISWEQEALNKGFKGFKGLRITKNTHWLEEKNRDEFDEYKSTANSSVHDYNIIALCSFSFEKCTPSDIADIVSSHQCTFIKKNNKIRRIESGEYKRAETILLKGYKDLENKINQRTAELLKSLEEKEILLREIHHRVKNNMQMISSLISLHSSKIEEESSVKVLEECQSRIKSMAFVHEELYRSDNFATLNLSEYISNLGNLILKSYTSNPGKIKLDLDINNVVLDIDTSVACGLILNELITNSSKYAFPGEEKGNIKISVIVNDNNANLIVSDNGIGFAGSFDFNNCKTPGLRLVKMLTTQLDGSLEFNNGKGTYYKIEFPLKRTAI